MGKHVERAVGQEVKTTGFKEFKLEKNKLFKELVEKVGNLELALQALTEKLNKFEENKVV